MPIIRDTIEVYKKMQLRVSTLNKNYTLKPTREYIVGSGEDYDISLPQLSTNSIRYIKFSYEPEESCWYADELDKSGGMFVDGQHIAHCPIRSEIKINIAGNISLIVSPEIVTHTSSTLSKPTNISNQPNINPIHQAPTYSIGEIANRIPIINLGFRWFKIGAPDDGVGTRLSQFDLHQTYSVDREKLDQICNVLHDRVYKSVTDGTLRDAKVRPVMFRKSTLLHHDSRRYVLVTRDTVHGSRTTVLVRFLSYGDNLYLGLDVYSLGNFNWFKFLLKVVLTTILSLLTWVSPIFLIIFLPILWWKLIWRISYERKIGLAFRQEFPGKIGSGPFDYDDVFMFAKSTVHLVVMTIRDVFKEENLPLDSLDSFIQNINNITIDTGGGALSMIGSAIGIDNKVQ